MTIVGIIATAFSPRSTFRTVTMRASMTTVATSQGQSLICFPEHRGRARVPCSNASRSLNEACGPEQCRPHTRPHFGSKGGRIKRVRSAYPVRPHYGTQQHTGQVPYVHKRGGGAPGRSRAHQRQRWLLIHAHRQYRLEVRLWSVVSRKIFYFEQ